MKSEVHIIYNLSYYLRKSVLHCIVMLLVLSSPIHAITYYVSPNGSNNHKGTQWFRPLFTIQKAHDMAEAGDTIMVMNGEYINYSDKQNTRITKSGSPEKWIIYKNYPGHKPVIRVYNEYGFYLNQVNYISIEGFSFKEYILPKDSTSTGRKIGICVEGSDTRPCTNIRIYNNDFAYCPTAGLLVNFFDHAKIQYNRFFKNASQQTAYGALVMMNGILTDQQNMTHNDITGNVFEKNGILDDRKNLTESHHFQNAAVKILDVDGTDGFEVARTRLTNNILYTNGCGGIYITQSNGIDIINNTLYKNNEETYCHIGEMQINHSTSIQVYNNIFHASATKNASHSKGKCQIDYRNNLYYNFSYFDLGENDMVADPQFENVGKTEGLYNFRLQPQSQAINTGIDTLLPGIDFEGNVRKYGIHADRGALEYTTQVIPSFKNEKNPIKTSKSIQSNWSSYYNKDGKTYTIWNNHTRGFIFKMSNSKGEVVFEKLDMENGQTMLEVDLRKYSPGIYEIVVFNDKDNFSEKITLE